MPVRLVVDTNVVIDWLVFNDPFMSPLRDGVPAGRVEVLTCPDILAELQRVLGYRSLKLSTERQRDVFDRYRTQTVEPPVPPGFGRKSLMTPGGFPRCRDRDDEIFIALAHHAKADALVSRDNAVLGLKRRLAMYGFDVLDVRQAMSMLSRAATR